MPKPLTFVRLGAIALMAASPVLAGNGHFLHGIGAINSSMGGAGVSVATDPLSSVHGNPALVAHHMGTISVISTEFFKPSLSMSTRGTVPTPDGGTFFVDQTTDSEDELGVLPAVAWSHKFDPESKLTIAGGLIAAAGFRTAWPVDPTSLVLAQQPRGFGRLQTELAITKYPFTAAYKVRNDLAVGASLLLFQGRLVIQPLPVVLPDCPDVGGDGGGRADDCLSPSDGSVAQDTISFRPGTSGPVGSWAPAIQVGAHYQPSDMLSVGLSFTSGANFKKYEWDSNNSNPYLYDAAGQITGPNPEYGLPRKISIDIDGPPILSLGIGIHPSEKLDIAIDGRWVGYKNTSGIGEPTGVGPTQELIGIGWQDILIGMVGARYRANDKLQLRAGVNINQSPIKEEWTLNSGGTPSTFDQHYTLGASYKVGPHLTADFGFYYTPESTRTGPIYNSITWNNPDPSKRWPQQDRDWEVDLSNGIVSGLVGLTFGF